jgi:OHCU decarboxylase
MNQRRWRMAEVNGLDRDQFVRIFGPLFEHSPWIADATWPRRPFATLDALHRVFCETVEQAGEDMQLELIRAHPDLVGRAALAGTLTPASTREQAEAGLDRLGPDEITAFQNFNQQYRDKFGFPFVICARLNKKEAILAAFPLRVQNSRAAEIQTALAEISKIARLRLEDLVDG